MIQFGETVVRGAAMATSPNALLDRIRREYLEMPGLRLTVPQARRLWGVPQDVCEDALARLVEEGFLRRTVDGAFIRQAGFPA
jgi:Fic family protein